MMKGRSEKPTKIIFIEKKIRKKEWFSKKKLLKIFLQSEEHKSKLLLLNQNFFRILNKRLPLQCYTLFAICLCIYQQIFYLVLWE